MRIRQLVLRACVWLLLFACVMWFGMLAAYATTGCDGDSWDYSFSDQSGTIVFPGSEGGAACSAISSWYSANTGSVVTSCTQTGANAVSYVRDYSINVTATRTGCTTSGGTGGTTGASDADIYAACLEIFAALLAAMSVIWGTKQVLRVLDHSRNEG